MAEFQTVTRMSNWGYWEQIGGKDIKPGRYTIQWPDGTESTENVVVECVPFSYGDMGHTYESEDCKAFAVISNRGADSRIHLLGLMIKPVE